MEEEIQRLPESKRINGLLYRLIKRTNNVAMYATYLPDEEIRIIGYEVFKIRIKKERVIFNKKLPLKEAFPRNEQFGNNAFSCTSREKAEELFQKISQNINKPQEYDTFVQ